MKNLVATTFSLQSHEEESVDKRQPSDDDDDDGLR